MGRRDPAPFGTATPDSVSSVYSVRYCSGCQCVDRKYKLLRALTVMLYGTYPTDSVPDPGPRARVTATGSVDCLLYRRGCVAAPVSPKTKEILTAVKPHNPSISDLPHDHPSSVARQQRKKPDPWPPQAAGALKIALLGAHGEHGPRGALEELDQSMLLLRHLSVLCSSHVQAIPRPCGGIDQSL